MFGFLKNALFAAAAALVIGTGAAGAVTFNLATNGGNGGGTVGAALPNGFSLTLVSNESAADVTTTWTALADQAYNVAFNWTYFTTDVDGSSFDTFGYFIGSTFTQLSTNGQPVGFNEAGSLSFLVAAGQSFGFYISNFVGGFGPAFASMRGTLEPAVVPVPAAGVLLLAALAGLGLMRTRRRYTV